MNVIYRPTVLTLFGFATIVAAISGTAGYILGRAPSLPPVVAVHFDHQAIADRFVHTTYPIVLVPVWIQLTLTAMFVSSPYYSPTMPAALIGAAHFAISFSTNFCK